MSSSKRFDNCYSGNGLLTGTPEINTDPLTCDCGGEMIQTDRGFACRECGLEPEEEIKILRNYRPYSVNAVQNEISTRRNMGTPRERSCNKNSLELERLNRKNLQRTHEIQVIEEAKIEIRRILGNLRMSNKEADSILKIFKKFRKSLKKGSKFRAPRKLVPVSIYFYRKINNLPISEKELLCVADITKNELKDFKPLFHNHSEYKERDRKTYAKQKVLEVIETYKLDNSLYAQAVKVLDGFWSRLESSPDDVISGFILTLPILSNYDKYKKNFNIRTLCKKLNIQPSTMQTQVKKNIFYRFNIPGFTSLVKSSKILRKVLIKLGIIEEEIIEIKLGNANPVFNFNENDDYYYYFIFNRDKDQIELAFSKKNHRLMPWLIKKKKKRINVRTKLTNGKDFLMLLTGKGPPYY